MCEADFVFGAMRISSHKQELRVPMDPADETKLKGGSIRCVPDPCLQKIHFGWKPVCVFGDQRLIKQHILYRYTIMPNKFATHFCYLKQLNFGPEA